MTSKPETSKPETSNPEPSKPELVDGWRYSHDIQLQELLKSVLQAEIPPREAMERMFDARNHLDESELADLSMDTADAELSIRGRGPRQVLYETGDVAFDIVIDAGRVSGQVVGHRPEQHGQIELVGTDNLIESGVDEVGEFGFDARPDGPFYIRLKSGPRTGWILT